MTPLVPQVIERERFDGDTFVVIDVNGRDIERWGRDRHWYVFQGLCNCGGVLTPAEPTQFRRLSPTAPQLLAHCVRCGDVWLFAVRGTVPI
jgi:hypothetical protein